MNKLKEILTSLHEGDQVELETAEGQGGERVAVDTLYFESGVWMRSTLSCWSSRWAGMGTCNCISHPTYHAERISRKEMLSHLRSYLRQRAEDTATRQAEVAWLEEQLKAL